MDNNLKSVSVICAGLVVMIMFILTIPLTTPLSTPAVDAQQATHSLTLGKVCVTPRFIQQNIDCSATATHSDGFGDTTILLDAKDCVGGNIALTGGNMLPLVCTGGTIEPMTITAITGNAACTTGPTFPCIIGPASSTNTVGMLTLPGVSSPGAVTVRDNSFLLGSVGTVLDQAGVAWQDACDAPGTMGCNTTTTNLATGPGSTLVVIRESSVTTQSSRTGSVPPGTPVTDTATVTGSGPSPPTPTGDVNFFLCGPLALLSDGCPSGGTSVGSGTLAGSGGSATATSPSVNTGSDPLADGIYCWRAGYGGDSNYGPSTEPGTDPDECFTIAQVTEPPVGGEILPIDMTSLFVAGALTSSLYWLGPIIAVGVVIVLRARMRKNTKKSF